MDSRARGVERYRVRIGSTRACLVGSQLAPRRAAEQGPVTGDCCKDPIPVFTAAKDSMASKAAQVYLNKLIARYGKVQELKLDSRAKTIRATCLLEGETQPIVVHAENYVIESEGDKKFIRIASCSCNRPWLQNLITDFLQTRRIELPSWAASNL